MIKNMIFKEWKEKLWVPVFSLVFLILFAVAAVVFAERKDFLDSLTGGIQLFFLPLVGILLGASGFSAEFKDGSWAYLFSRPIKKSSIWITKFAALAGLLIAIFLAYFLVLPLFAGFKEPLIETSLWGLSALISFGLYTVSFSLAFLTEKPILLFFLSLFIFMAFQFLAVLLLRALSPDLMSRSLVNLPGLQILFGVIGAIALAAASLYAFCRTDFSRPQSKISGFLKSLVVFLVIGTVLGGVGFIIVKQNPKTSFLYAYVTKNEAILFSNRGIFRYDPGRERLIKLIGPRKTFGYFGVEIDGGKIVWAEDSLSRAKKIPEWSQEIWIMGTDGRNKKMILKTSDKPDSPLKGRIISRIHLSPDGQKLLLVSHDGIQFRNPLVLWSLNSDGSGLRSFAADGPDAAWIYCRGWSPGNSRVLIDVTGEIQKISKGYSRNHRQRILSLDSGEWSPPPDEELSGFHLFGLSPNADRLGYFGPKNILRLIDLKSMSTSDLISVPDVQTASWDATGDQIAFLADRGRRLGIISVPEKKILAERTLEGLKTERIPWTMDWTDNGQKIALSDFKDSGYTLRIFDQALRTEKAFPLPPTQKALVNLPHIYGSGAKVLVYDAPGSQLWSFDPATEKWKKLF